MPAGNGSACTCDSQIHSCTPLLSTTGYEPVMKILGGWEIVFLMEPPGALRRQRSIEPTAAAGQCVIGGQDGNGCRRVSLHRIAGGFSHRDAVARCEVLRILELQNVSRCDGSLRAERRRVDVAGQPTRRPAGGDVARRRHVRPKSRETVTAPGGQLDATAEDLVVRIGAQRSGRRPRRAGSRS